MIRKERKEEKGDKVMKIKRLFSVVLLLVILCSLIAPARVAATQSQATRDTVLVLDISGSMDGKPMKALRSAAVKFCEAVLQDTAKNRVAIVVYNASGKVLCEFSDDLTLLEQRISSLDAYGGTNMYEAMQEADRLLMNSSADKKNIVLMSDGLPNRGENTADGPYGSNDYDYYQYANAVYSYATSLHSGYMIYTLGFFHSLYTYEKDFATRFLRDLQNGGYYEVENPDELEFRFGEIAEEITADQIETQFTYLSGESNYTATCYYEDDFFNNSAMQYDPSLATMSLSLAMSGFSSASQNTSNPDGNNSENVQALLSNLKFDPDSFQANEGYNRPSETDSIGVAAAMKELPNDTTLLAVVVRGGGYGSEWGGNFKLGYSGEHEGFEIASEKVLSFLRAYCSDKVFKSNVKVWIVGYSRGAAVANITAAWLSCGVQLRSDIVLSNENIYAYCFETPAGTASVNARDLDYFGNIHNIINPNDVVPKVAPRAMGFRRYGVDHYLPCAATASDYSVRKARMTDQYYLLPSTERYIVDDFSVKQVSISTDVSKILPGGDKFITIELTDAPSTMQEGMGVVLQDVLDTLCLYYIDRPTYYNQLQDGVVSAIQMITSSEIKFDNFGDTLWEKLKGHKFHLFLKLAYNEYGAYDEFMEYVLESYEDCGGHVEDKELLRTAAQPLIDKLLAYGANNLSNMASLIGNGGELAAAHYPELCLAWLRSEDPIYAEDAIPRSETAEYRIVRINCPVDVTVQDNNGNILAQFTADEAQAYENGLLSYINDNGEKMVVLPADAEYSLEIGATETAEVNFSVDERSFDSVGTERAVNYYALQMQKGEKLYAITPAYSEEELSETDAASSTTYTLKNEAGEVLTPDEDLIGDEANKAYLVSVESSDTALGEVYGSGKFRNGTFAQVQAAVKEDAVFDGWFVEDTLVSEEPDYRFCVREDISLTAKFSKKEPVEMESTQPTENTMPPETEPAPETEATPVEMPENGISSTQIALIALAAVAVIACAVLIGALLIRKGKNEEGEANEVSQHDGNDISVLRPAVSKPAAEPSKPKPCIRVLNGTMEGMAFHFDAGETIRIGRSPTQSEIIMDSSYSKVSRMHCMVTFDEQENQYVVVDSSSGGTYYQNRVRLVKGYRTPIRRGTTLLLADTGCIIVLE